MDIRGASTIELLDAFAAGMYLLFGVIHIDLWLKRRDRPSHLWLAAAAGGALLVNLSGMVLRGTELTSGFLPLLNLLGGATVAVSLLELVYALGNETPSRFARGVAAFLVVLAFAGALTGTLALIALFFVICSALFVWAMMYAIRAGRRGDWESRAIAAGLVILVVTLIVDVLRMFGVVNAPSGIPIAGFAAIFLIAASALNSRYEREHRELVALREELEERVSTRTKELEEANTRLAEVSRTDVLTGLPNRRGFLDVVDHEMKRSSRAGEPFSVIMLDIDHFKQINDRYGHAAGDAALEVTGSRLRSVLRAQDVVARWGGEEFIVLLPNTKEEAAVLVAEKARRELSTLSFERHGVKETITASFGVATHRRGQELEQTIAAADQALYGAKEAGRDCVVLAP